MKKNSKNSNVAVFDIPTTIGTEDFIDDLIIEINKAVGINAEIKLDNYWKEIMNGSDIKVNFKKIIKKLKEIKNGKR